MKKDRILLVEDDAEMREEMISVLQENDYLADMAKDGTAAISCLEKDSYALLLLDLKMPGINGYEVLKYARKFHPGVKVLVLSGSPLRPEQQKSEDQIFPSGADYERLIAQEADGFINKPFDVDEVLKKMKTILSVS